MSVSDSELITTSNFNDNNACPICYDFAHSSVNLRCGHKLCLECFIKSVNTINIKCPLCRDLVTEAEPILTTFNKLLHETNLLMLKIEEQATNIELKDNLIDTLRDILKEKDDKIEEYRETLLETNKQNITLLNRLLEKLEQNE